MESNEKELANAFITLTKFIKTSNVCKLLDDSGRLIIDDAVKNGILIKYDEKFVKKNW